MASILDAMGPYVMQLIADMATEEVKMLLGISSEIEKLENKMESIKCFLADAERKRITEFSVQRWVQKLKNAMYDATDILDLCQIEADKQKESKGSSMVEKAPDCCRAFLSCLRNPVFAHKIGSRIKELNQRLDNIYEEAHKFNFIINLASHPEQRMSTREKVTSEFVESAIVGEKIERETRELAQLLTINGHHDIKVVAIVGTGGMGKTTLAQKIFNETTVQEHFKMKIWLSITQHFDEVELLRTTIEHAGGVHDGLQDRTLLSRKLTNTLSTGRFLLVLDDVWSTVAWSNVLSVPVRNATKNQHGNWVLMTTRLEDLALQTGASFYQHHVSPLNEDDAWLLLNKQLPPTPGQVHEGTDHLKDVGMKIICKCGGLPLAIKVMGGLLSTKSRSEGAWEAVLNHSAWSIAGLPKELDNAIYLSYEDLSPQVKQCFLYCSLFPKGTIISNATVVPMWISEGFIHPPDGSSISYADQLEEIADGYYQELITRNLIEPRKGLVTHYKCTMHDVVRSFAEFICKEESLVVQDEQDGAGTKHSQVHRLSIGSTKSTLEWDSLQKYKSVRTLIISHRINVQPSDSLGSCSTLRVLLISGGTDCDRLVDSLCQLRHLRYLHFEDTNISRLPGDIHKLKFLQHIVVYSCPHLDHLPSTITQLLHLRTLDMSDSHENVLVPKGLGQLRNLRSLQGFRVHSDMDDGAWCSLDEIGPLSHLRYLSLHGLENVPAISSAEMARISSKENLDYLVLEWSCSRFMGLRDEVNKLQHQRLVEEVIEKLTPPCSIRHLHIEGYSGCQLPNWMMVPATCVFKSLRHLRMDNLSCCTQLPNGLCQLPCLESLAINDAPAIKIVGPEFKSPSSSLLVGGSIATAGSVVGFPNLTTLYLAELCEWEEWDWEEGSNGETTEPMAMPALKGLVIINCKLSSLPTGLATSRRLSLRRLALYQLSNLTYIDNFTSVVELIVCECPKLKRISNLSKLQKIEISYCPNVEVLEGVSSLDSMEMEDGSMETVPEYVTTVSPRYLKLTCSKKLYESMKTGSSSSECDKISHIESRTIYYTEDED